MAFAALRELFWVGALPCAGAIVALLAGRRLGLRPAAAWAVSIGIGLILGQLGLEARVNWSSALAKLWRPHEARDWLPWLLLLAVGLGILADYATGWWGHWTRGMACFFAASVPLRLIKPHLVLPWSFLTKVALCICWSGVIGLVWWTLTAGRDGGRPLIRSGLLAVVAVGMAATITLAGSFSYGEFACVVAAAITGTLAGEALVQSWGMTAPTDWNDGLAGASGVLAVAFGGLALLSYFYVGLGALKTALLLLAVAAAGGWLPTNWPQSALGQVVSRIALCLVPLIVALAIAIAAVTGNSEGDFYR